MAGGASNDTDEAITGINVTPLVDITLVLLIIFMVTAKIIVSQSVPLDLPKAASGTDVQTVFSIVMASNGAIQVDSKPLPNEDAILPIAREAHARNAELRAVIKADSMVTHGHVIHVLDLLKQAGVSKIAFGVTPIQPLAPAPGGAPPAPAPNPPNAQQTPSPPPPPPP
jgi:biopolymer transport protein ExbD